MIFENAELFWFSPHNSQRWWLRWIEIIQSTMKLFLKNDSTIIQNSTIKLFIVDTTYIIFENQETSI